MGVMSNSIRQYLEHQAEMVRLEQRLNRTYRFAHECCREIYKHTGSYDYYEKLDQLIKDTK